MKARSLYSELRTLGVEVHMREDSRDPTGYHAKFGVRVRAFLLLGNRIQIQAATYGLVLSSIASPSRSARFAPMRRARPGTSSTIPSPKTSHAATM